MVEDGNELGTAESWGRAEEEEKAATALGLGRRGIRPRGRRRQRIAAEDQRRWGFDHSDSSGWPRQKRGRGGGATTKEEEMKREGRGGRRWRRWPRQRRQWLAKEEGGGVDGGRELQDLVEEREGREEKPSAGGGGHRKVQWRVPEGGGKRRVGEEQGDDGGFPNSGDGKADDEGGWRRRNGIRWRNRREKERMKPTRM